MNKDVKVTATCKWCGSSLSPTHTGPCPKCGKEGKKSTVKIKGTIGFKGSLNWESRREFCEANPKIKWLIIAITFGSPLLGFVLSGLVGFVIGLFFGFFSYWLGPLAVTKVREIERGSS